MAEFVYLKNVVTLEVSREKCTGCGLCMTVCPRAVFQKDNGKVSIRARDHCIECGACALNCPVQAIQVQKGVGCAAAVINTFLSRSGSDCCCLNDTHNGERLGGDFKPGRTSSCC